MTPDAPRPSAASAGASDAGADFASFDDLVEDLGRFARSLPDWPPARRVRGEWEEVEPRLDRARRELSRMLVVGVIGGTGTGKSTLVNALSGRDSSPAGDVARPTTIQPVVVAAPDVDLAWLPVDAMRACVVRSDAPAVANIVLVDCPDPDTQAEPPRDGTAASEGPARPSDSNRNRDLLEAVLPSCDVLLLVSTAQKYRSWIVAREVAAFAPGRPLLFVQTHAARDPDIRDDWRRELETQGFSVPRIFRLDGVEAAARAAAGLAPDPGFRELVVAIDGELVGRAARRVRRTGALDLAGWFLDRTSDSVGPLREPVAQLAAGIDRERARLEAILAREVGLRLRSSRTSWQRILDDELVERWHGGPFGLFLRAVASLSAWWPRLRAASGGLIGRILEGRPADTGAPAGWQAVEELGLSAAEVEQSRSILVGLAARARVAEPFVGRARLDESRLQTTVGGLLDRTKGWLSAGIERLVAGRRGRIDGTLWRWACEALFSGLLAAILARAGWNFFVGHLWQGRAIDGGGFLQEAAIWMILWGLALRWFALARIRSGLDGDIQTLLARLPEARLADPLLEDFASAAAATGRFLDDADRLGREHRGLAERLAAPAGDLGRLRGPRS